MRKISLSNLASMAEIFAAVVVVISLFYIGAELRQNTTALHNNAWQSLIDKMVALDIAEAADSELSQLMMTAEVSPDSLTEVEWWRFSKLAAGRLGEVEYAFLAQTSGSLDKYRWGAMEGYLVHLLCMPGYRKFWLERSDTLFHPDFVALVRETVIPACEGQLSPN